MSGPAIRPVERSARPEARTTVTMDRIPSVRRRVGAYVIDVLLLSVLTEGTVFLLSLLSLGGRPAGPNPLDPGRIAGSGTYLAGLLVDAVYFVVLWHAKGRTIGMRALGLRVLRVTDAARLGWREAIIRWLALEWVFWASFLLGLTGWITSLPIDLLSLAWFAYLIIATRRGRDHRGPHDRWSGSIVIQRDARA